MQNYEAKKPSYFATPSPQLIHALHTALTQILAKPLAERFDRHREVSDKIKGVVADLGLKQVAAKPEDQAHAMTAIYLPEIVKAAELLPILAKKGVVFAGGIHKEIAPKYIRFGHMGVSVVSRPLCLKRARIKDKTMCMANLSASDGSSQARHRQRLEGTRAGSGGVRLPKGVDKMGRKRTAASSVFDVYNLNSPGIFEADRIFWPSNVRSVDWTHEHEHAFMCFSSLRAGCSRDRCVGCATTSQFSTCHPLALR